ncbi:hypothetical protein [Dactylosporangium sp. NPDC049140]|uniref:hypothetical protein n=1 Tax=Dactylosporangium sp. NPDC049140 TaxID=3155647 RepID=UPI0033F94CB4
MGGSFGNAIVNGRNIPRARLAAFNARTGALLDRAPSADATVRALATGMGGQGGRAAAYGPDGHQRWIRVFDGDVQAVTALGGVAYIGGHFDRAGKTAKNGNQGACTDGSPPRVKLAAVDGAGRLLDWAPQANDIVGVRTLTASEPLRRLVAGGEFTMVAGASWKRLAVFG